MLGDGARDLHDGRFLKCVYANHAAGDLAGDCDNGDAVQECVDKATHEVGGAGAGGRATDADLAGDARIAFCGEAGVLFVTHEDVTNVTVIEGVIKR